MVTLASSASIFQPLTATPTTVVSSSCHAHIEFTDANIVRGSPGDVEGVVLSGEGEGGEGEGKGGEADIR